MDIVPLLLLRATPTQLGEDILLNCAQNKVFISYGRLSDFCNNKA